MTYDATRWLMQRPDMHGMKFGYFGAASTGAALVAAAELRDELGAVVSRGGRPDLAGDALGSVHAPTLLIVGGDDEPVIGMNRTLWRNFIAMTRSSSLSPGATHLFEEPGILEELAHLAASWFQQYLNSAKKPTVRASARL